MADVIAAARQAYETVWSKTSGKVRARLVHRIADLLEANAERMSALETTDNDKVIRETHGQMHFAARVYHQGARRHGAR